MIALGLGRVEAGTQERRKIMSALQGSVAEKHWKITTIYQGGAAESFAPDLASAEQLAKNICAQGMLACAKSAVSPRTFVPPHSVIRIELEEVEKT